MRRSTIRMAAMALAVAMMSGSAAPSVGAARTPPVCAAPAPVAQGEVRARFMGVSTILIEDGRTQILVDGYFSRPNILKVYLGTLEPDVGRIGEALCLAGIGKAAAVLTAHAHFDHALDSAEIVGLDRAALLVGSESVANIGRGRDLTEDQIKVIETTETFPVGEFDVTAVPAPHASKVRWEGEITERLVPPAKVEAYREGGNFSFLIVGHGRRILVHPSAGSYPGLYAGVKADVVFLAVGGLGVKDEAVTRALWEEAVRRTGARRVILIHWDDLGGRLTGGLKAAPWPLDDVKETRRRIAGLAAEDAAAGRPVRVEAEPAPFAEIVL